MTTRTLMTLPYWLMMAVLAVCRIVITWAYFFLFIAGVGATIAELGESLARPKLAGIMGMAITVVWTITSGLAWWTTLRSNRSHRSWVVAASVAYLLSVSAYLVETRFRFSALGFLWAFVVIGLLGLSTFLFPYRVKWSVSPLSRVAEGSGHWGQTPLGWLLVAGRIAITLVYCLLTAAAICALGYEIKKSSMRPNAVGIGWLCIMILVFGVTCWTTMRKSDSHKAWVFVSSGFNMLSAAFMLAWRPFLYPSISLFWLFVIIGIGGLTVYILPYLLQNSVVIFSYKVSQPAYRLKELRISL